MPNATPSAFHRFRNNLESGFARWGEISFDHPWKIILAIFATVVFFSTYLPQIEVDMSTEGYLHEDDPARAVYHEFQVEFGRDEKIVVIAQNDEGIITPAFLQKLKALHEELEAIPQVEKVDSLINARRTYGRDDELIVEDLMEDWPSSAADYERLRHIVATTPLYQKLYANAAMNKTLLIITPDTYSVPPHSDDAAELADFDFDAGFDDAALDAAFDNSAFDEPAMEDGAIAPETSSAEEAVFLSGDELFAIIDKSKAVTDAHNQENFRTGMAGSPYMMHQLTYVLGKDMFMFSFIGIFIISLLLFWLFRRWVMVILPVSISTIAMYFTFTLIAFIGKPVTTAVQILPSLLLAVGVGNAVHIFTVYFQAIDRGNDKRSALSYALGHSGLAVVMTGLTTAGGLISFITADMKPVSDIGIVSPMGIICTLFFSIMLLPAVIAVTPIKATGLKQDTAAWAQGFLARCAYWATHYPRAMVLGWFAVLAVCLILVAKIVPSHYPLHWFAEGHDLRVNTEVIDDNFGGATYMEIIIDTGEENGLHDPALLKSVDEAARFIGQLRINGVQAGNSSSLIDINKELHQALNGNDENYYAIPDERDLIAQELLLFENSGSDDLVDIVDTQFSKMRLTIRMPFVDGTKYPEYVDALESGVVDIIGDQAEVTFTGIVSILSRTVKVLIGDTIRAYLLAFMIISPLMMLLVGSVRTGLISMIPNLAPIIITLALMSVLGIPLDAFTLLIGSIALGLAVDDTIHFMHNYQRYYGETGDNEYAVKETLRTTGRALLMTSLVLSAGFFVNMMGEMLNLQNFGLLTGVCIILAFLSDALLAPALMTLLSQVKQRKQA